MAILKIDKALFEEKVRNGSQPVLIEYQAPWCVYCRRIAPAFKKLAAEYEGKLLIGELNIDDEPQIAEAEGIEVVPSMVIYKDGKALGKIVAPDSKAKIEDFIKENLGL